MERGHRYRGIKRRDTNHAEIVALLGDIPPLQVIDCSQFGDDFPDLQLGAYGHWLQLEIKFGRGKLRPGQETYAREAKGPVVACWTVAEVLEVVTAWLRWAANTPRFRRPGGAENGAGFCG